MYNVMVRGTAPKTIECPNPDCDAILEVPEPEETNKRLTIQEISCITCGNQTNLKVLK